MSFENGQIFWDPALPTLDNNRRTEIYREMNRVLAALHDIDIEAAGLADFGRAGNYFERQICRWTKQYRASETEPVPSMDMLIDWLAINIPEDDGKTCLIHGDFRLDNIIFHPTDSHALALLDWELSTLGHPYADVVHQCMQLRLKNDAVIAGLGEINRNHSGSQMKKSTLNNTATVEKSAQYLIGIFTWHSVFFVLLPSCKLY